MLHSLYAPIITNVMLTILHQIFKLSEQFSKTDILSIKYFCGTELTVISIPK